MRQKKNLHCSHYIHFQYLIIHIFFLQWNHETIIEFPEMIIVWFEMDQLNLVRVINL